MTDQPQVQDIEPAHYYMSALMRLKARCEDRVAVIGDNSRDARWLDKLPDAQEELDAINWAIEVETTTTTIMGRLAGEAGRAAP